MRAFLIWTIAEVSVVLAASSLWGFHSAYEWRLHNQWIAIPLYVICAVSIARKLRERT